MFGTMPRHIKRPATAQEAKRSIYCEYIDRTFIEDIFFFGIPNPTPGMNNTICFGGAFWKKSGSPILKFMLKATNRQIAIARYHGLDIFAPISLSMKCPYGHIIHPEGHNIFIHLSALGDYENLRILFQKVQHPRLTKEHKKDLIDIALTIRKATMSGPITDHSVPHTNPMFHKTKDKEEPFVQRDCVPLREPIKTCTDRSWTPTSLLLMIVLGNIVVAPFVDQFIKLIERILPCLQ